MWQEKDADAKAGGQSWRAESQVLMTAMPEGISKPAYSFQRAEACLLCVLPLPAQLGFLSPAIKVLTQPETEGGNNP